MVYHVMKDGTTTNDITGHIVKLSEAESVYRLMLDRSRGRKDKRRTTDKKKCVNS